MFPISYSLFPVPFPHLVNSQPSILAFGHATRTTFNLGLWPRYANNLQPWPLATLREQPSTFNLGLWPRYANNLQPWPLATLREQPSTLFNLQPYSTFNSLFC
ncbi:MULTISPECIES: hypothetical protein [Moorena]|uniref:Uncharacterized protein n=1 Tax=Moorena producens 3L TaxID=489825 RepID=F4XP56_9CYAN|nr:MULTISPECIES: hypothetical protein [Moorena]EGJ33591.1 hypothetical protein LYNGBM3L_28670 [Moorena producens 3L]NEP32204.1 hypothetical protein [Moorena sp. SIO3B2]NEP68938.1 hypothetical protein [Moorena sp. SIO3A5]NER88524.1 hypothetical protein [Moorena sp. SIO3A2]